MKSSLLAWFALGVTLTNSSAESWAKCPNSLSADVQELIATIPNDEWLKHFEQKAPYLRQRIVNDKIRTASSFADRPTLENAIMTAYTQNQSVVQNWWANAAPGEYREFDGTGTFAGLTVSCPMKLPRGQKTCTDKTESGEYEYKNEVQGIRIVLKYFGDMKKCGLLTAF